MKNPFKKADSAKLPEQGRERTEIDYAHRTIIHHMLYGYPGDFSSCASYPEYDDPEMFAGVLEQAADAVKKLDLDEHTPVFDELVRLKAQQLAISSLGDPVSAPCIGTEPAGGSPTTGGKPPRQQEAH